MRKTTYKSSSPVAKGGLGGILTARASSSELRTAQPRCCTALSEAPVYSGALSLLFIEFKGVYDEKLLYLVGWAPSDNLGRQATWKQTTCGSIP